MMGIYVNAYIKRRRRRLIKSGVDVCVWDKAIKLKFDFFGKCQDYSNIFILNKTVFI